MAGEVTASPSNIAPVLAPVAIVETDTPELTTKSSVPVIIEATLMVIDKRTARKHTYTIIEGRTFTHETLEVQVKKCWNEPDVAVYPEQAALVEIHEATAGQGLENVFTGWLFANKSELSNIQHQAYDVTLVACTRVMQEPVASDSVTQPTQKAQ